MSAYGELLGYPKFQPGDRVKVGPNDAKVLVGSVGTVAAVATETGNPIVDVEGRGRVALTPSSLTIVPANRFSLAETRNGCAHTTAQPPATGGAAQPTNPVTALRTETMPSPTADVASTPKPRQHSEAAKAKMREAARRRRENAASVNAAGAELTKALETPASTPANGSPITTPPSPQPTQETAAFVPLPAVVDLHPGVPPQPPSRDAQAVRTTIALAARAQLSASTLMTLCRLLQRLEDGEDAP